MAASARFELAKCHSQSVVPYRLATRQYIPQLMVEGDGFEPSNPKEQIYSLSRLATSLSLQLVPKTGIEPVTY